MASGIAEYHLRCGQTHLNGQARGGLMDDRKYRQRGYMEHDRGAKENDRRGEPRLKTKLKPADREGPRSPKMMAYGQKVKCSSCGAVIQANIDQDATCPKCKADLHTCRQCTFFDPGARFECRKPITARIANKGARNTCELFAARTVVERETSSGKPTDAKQAFANLFKK
jgi:predicted RNA-binding Zn-ribbon protein involved in translation (DUF1610 family)